MGVTCIMRGGGVQILVEQIIIIDSCEQNYKENKATQHISLPSNFAGDLIFSRGSILPTLWIQSPGTSQLLHEAMLEILKKHNVCIIKRLFVTQFVDSLCLDLFCLVYDKISYYLVLLSVSEAIKLREHVKKIAFLVDALR